jgi:Na+/H+-dicarboxylate symporter
MLPSAPEPADRPASRARFGLTALSLLALGAALGLGGLGRAQGGAFHEGLRAAAVPAGVLFVNALQMVVIPVVVTQLLAALVGPPGRDPLGRLGLRALGLFVGLLLAAGAYAVGVAPAVLGFVPVDPASIAALRAATVVPEAARAAAAAPALGGVADLLPASLFDALAKGSLLPVLLFTLLVGAAVQRLPAVQRDPLAALIHAAARAMLIAVGWVLWLTPLGVFALAYVLALGTGWQAAGLIGAFVAVVSLPMLAFTLLLYPVAVLGGRVGWAAFARAAAPAQLVAIATRSSLAALPALVDGARRHLGLSGAATGFVLPLSTATFKVNRTISAVLKLLFLAHVFGFEVPPLRLALFIGMVVVLSFTALGVPGGGGAFKTMPAYLFAGAPIEGIVILEAADVIPDVFKTLLNVTGDMAAATLLTRGERTAEAGAIEAATEGGAG